ncbi:MAG: hypothetical protein ACK5WZ_12255, partial [Pseudobdellovibrionaceae bacterium]
NYLTLQIIPRNKTKVIQPQEALDSTVGTKKKFRWSVSKKKMELPWNRCGPILKRVLKDYFYD